MTPEERKQYVKYRVDSAYKTVEAAKLLADRGFWNSAVNRLYYAIFFINLTCFNEMLRKITFCSRVCLPKMHHNFYLRGIVLSCQCLPEYVRGKSCRPSFKEAVSYVHQLPSDDRFPLITHRSPLHKNMILSFLHHPM